MSTTAVVCKAVVSTMSDSPTVRATAPGTPRVAECLHAVAGG